MSAQQVASPRDRGSSFVHRLWPTLILLLAATAQAGTNEWSSMGLQGGTIHDLAFHPTTPATMYAAAPNGFYRSTDSGATWQQASTPTTYYLRPSALAVTPGNPDHLYVALRDGGATRSVDRGSTLAHPTYLNVLEQLSSSSIAASLDGSAIYYGINSSVYRSTDQGATRQLRGTPPGFAYIGQLHVDRNDPQTVYAAAYGGLYRSTDGAASWQPLFLSTDPNLGGVWWIAVDPQNASRIWLATNTTLLVTVDGGSTWNSVLAHSVSDIDIDPANPNVVYASLLDGVVMRTIDGGVSWASLAVPQRAQLGRPRLAIVPNQSQRLYLFGSTGIFSSNDAGATWQRADAGIDATSPRGFSQNTAGAQRVYFPIAEYGIGLVRSDGTQVDVLLSPPPSFVAGAHPPNVTAVIAGGDQSRNLVAAFSGQYLGFSTNHGGQWTRASAGPPAGLQINALARAATGSRTIYAATSAGIYRSEDDGDHWVASSTGLPANTAVGSIVVTRNPMILFAAVNDLPNATYSIHKSTDGGINWASAAGVLHKRLVGTLAADPNDEQILIVGTNEGAFRTVDGGANWTTLQMFPTQATSPVSTVAIDPLDSRIIYFGDSGEIGRVFRSVDAGASFQNLMPDYYIGGAPVSLLIRAGEPDRIIASMDGNGVREFSISPDLQVAAAPNGSVAAGSQTSFTFTVINRGPFDATSIRLEAQLDGAATGISATSSNGSCTVVASSITCNTDVLRKDATVTVNLLGTPSAPGTLRADATVSARQPDSLSSNNSVSRTLTVTSASAPSTGGGGSGGGGAMSGFLLWVLALLCMKRCMACIQTKNPRRFPGGGLLSTDG
jgi:photosystem II stability/assembly factor-like uncharacterized protein